MEASLQEDPAGQLKGVAAGGQMTQQRLGRRTPARFHILGEFAVVRPRHQGLRLSFPEIVGAPVQRAVGECWRPLRPLGDQAVELFHQFWHGEEGRATVKPVSRVPMLGQLAAHAGARFQHRHPMAACGHAHRRGQTADPGANDHHFFHRVACSKVPTTSGKHILNQAVYLSGFSAMSASRAFTSMYFTSQTFIGIGLCRDVAVPDEHVVELVLDHAVVQIRPVDEGKLRFQLTPHAHLFHQTALRRFHHGLSLTGVAAARVGPQAAAVVLLQRPSVDEQFAAAVEHEDAERPMEHPLTVGFHLFHGAELSVLWIHKNHIFDHRICFQKVQVSFFSFKVREEILDKRRMVRIVVPMARRQGLPHMLGVGGHGLVVVQKTWGVRLHAQAQQRQVWVVWQASRAASKTGRHVWNVVNLSNGFHNSWAFCSWAVA